VGIVRRRFGVRSPDLRDDAETGDDRQGTRVRRPAFTLVHAKPPGRDRAARRRSPILREAPTMAAIRISHRPTGLVIAEGPLGWGITRFEGNYYVRRRYLRRATFTPSPLPGLCPYKGLYQWLHLRLAGGESSRYLAWLYWLPNPLLPFIWFRVAIPGDHPEIEVRSLAGATERTGPARGPLTR